MPIKLEYLNYFLREEFCRFICLKFLYEKINLFIATYVFNKFRSAKDYN